MSVSSPSTLLRVSATSCVERPSGMIARLRFLETRHCVAQRGEALNGIRDFEQVLALDVAQGQQLGETESDPTRIVVTFARTVAPREPGLLDETFEDGRQQRKLDGYRHGRLIRPPPHFADYEAVAAHAGLLDPETPPAHDADPEQPVGQGIEIDDAGEGTDRRRQRGCVGLLPLHDQAYPECTLGSCALAHHVDVTQFEDPQAQRAARKQHGVEREQRDFLAPHQLSLARAERLEKPPRRVLESPIRYEYAVV